MYYLGIDLGGTNTVAGIVDGDYNIVNKVSLKTPKGDAAREVMDCIYEASVMAIEESGIDRSQIKCAGIGCPGTVNPIAGVVEYSNNVIMKNVHMREYLEPKLGMPFHMANDANAAAFGEYIAGAAKGAKDVIVITLGTGLGGGIIIGGKIYCGFNFGGAELGHMIIEKDGADCTCGSKGCFEAYGSATALIRMTRERMEQDKNTLMWEITQGSIENAKGRTAFDAMKKGDKAATEVVDMYLSYLSCGIIGLINIFQPEIFCIGGGISNEGDNLLLPLKKLVSGSTYGKDAAKQTKLCIASLKGDAGLIGAAMLWGNDS